MHIMSFLAMKALVNVQSIEICRNRLISAKTSISLRVNAFFCKHDVKFTKKRLIRSKIAFYAHHRF